MSFVVTAKRRPRAVVHRWEFVTMFTCPFSSRTSWIVQVSGWLSAEAWQRRDAAAENGPLSCRMYLDIFGGLRVWR
jgi:hypothetical protein